MQSLFYLYKHILINEYKKRFFSKSTVIGAAILIIISVFVVGIGFSIGFLVNYSRLHREIGAGDIFFEIKPIFLEVVLPVVLAKMASGMNSLRVVNLNNLKIFPVTKSAIFSFDIHVGLFDFMSPYLAAFLTGIIAGAGGFTESVSEAFIFILFLISVVYFVHIFGELFRSIKMLLSYLPKFPVVSVSVILIGILYLLFFKNLSFKAIVNNNPLSWDVSSIFSLAIFKETNWILSCIALNISFSIALLVLIISIRSIHAKLFSAHIVQTTPKIKQKKSEPLKLISFFPLRLQPYIDKDLKYLLRSSRSVSAIVLELLFLAFLGYMHFIHSKAYGNSYISLGLIVTFPAIIWDFYLSNTWGLERKGFGFYLFSNADFNSLIPSKNISFWLLKIPVIIIIAISFGLIFSFKYLPIIILLYLILYLTSLTFTNIVSIKNPYPVEFKESSLTRRQQQRISWIGFAGLLTYMGLTAAILFAQYKLKGSMVFYIIAACILIAILYIYKRVLSYSSLLLSKQKEFIYKELIKT